MILDLAIQNFSCPISETLDLRVTTVLQLTYQVEEVVLSGGFLLDTGNMSKYHTSHGVTSFGS